MKNNILLLLAGFIFVACHKDEIPIEPHETGDAIEAQAEMGQTYKNQLYYSLKNNTFVASNDKKIWQLGFESSATGWHIILNSANAMAVYRSDLNFDEIIDENGIEFDHWDYSSGNLDSTAIGDWQAENKLYIIDFGYDDQAAHMGYGKLIIESVNSTSYEISYGDISDVTPQQYTITKNTDNLFTYFSFQNGTITVAPPNETYDLVFTQYTHLFTNPFHSYLVTGVLLNRYNTTATKITDKDFYEIEYSDVVGLNYSPNLDIIGYSWKEYDFDQSIYAVDPSIIYIVKTNEGLFYKLHFIDFYNSQGIKGYPKFEMQAL